MSPSAILKFLEMVANNNLSVNAAMHLVVLVALGAVFLVKDASIRRLLFQASVSILFVSVAAHAAAFGNPFTSATFSLLGIAAIAELVWYRNDVAPSGSRLQSGLALVFILIGLWYPDFVHKSGAATLLFSAVGVIPCPTLLAGIGLLTLVYRGSGKLQYGVAVFMGLLYGIIGIFVLKVYLDVALLLLAVIAVYMYFTVKPDQIPD